MVVTPATKFGWYRISNTDAFLDSLMAETLPQGKCFKDESMWFVHSDYLLHVVRAGYTRLGFVDYKALNGTDQMSIASAKSSWKCYSRPLPVSTDSDPYAVLFLLPSAPHEIVKAAWKELSKLYHPDRGGDAQAFDQVQKAYKEINGKGTK